MWLCTQEVQSPMGETHTLVVAICGKGCGSWFCGNSGDEGMCQEGGDNVFPEAEINKVR